MLVLSIIKNRPRGLNSREERKAVKTINRLYPTLNMVPLAVMVYFAGAAIVRQGLPAEPTAPLFAVGILALVGAASTILLNPRH